MRGHEAIIRMRLRRQVPAIVFINDYPCLTDWERHGDHATVCVDGDVLQALDLRFLVGLRVSISSGNEDRARRLFEMAKSAGAAFVAAGHTKPDIQPWEQDGWTEIWRGQEVEHG